MGKRNTSIEGLLSEFLVSIKLSIHNTNKILRTQFAEKRQNRNGSNGTVKQVSFPPPKTRRHSEVVDADFFSSTAKSNSSISENQNLSNRGSRNS